MENKNKIKKSQIKINLNRDPMKGVFNSSTTYGYCRINEELGLESCKEQCIDCKYRDI